jgi:tRNA/rRNA methyltransferase
MPAPTGSAGGRPPPVPVIPCDSTAARRTPRRGAAGPVQADDLFMAGSDSSRASRQPGSSLPGPAIVLVRPQLGENIGAAARAMLNGGLFDLRLVQPRDPWPNPRAVAASSGADEVIAAARLFDSVSAAVADLRRLYAATARPRDMVKPVVTPREAVAEMRALALEPGDPTAGQGCGVLFGPERTGLENEEVGLADAVLNVPLNPAYSSLNLGQAVMLVAYEWFQSAVLEPPRRFDRGKPPATKEELATLYRHLEEELDAARFLLPLAKRPLMVQNLRNVLARAELTEQEVRTLHGVITALAGRKWRPPPQE